MIKVSQYFRHELDVTLGTCISVCAEPIFGNGARLDPRYVNRLSEVLSRCDDFSGASANHLRGTA
jgi:hypothetical protein